MELRDSGSESSDIQSSESDFDDFHRPAGDRAAVVYLSLDAKVSDVFKRKPELRHGDLVIHVSVPGIPALTVRYAVLAKGGEHVCLELWGDKGVIPLIITSKIEDPVEFYSSRICQGELSKIEVGSRYHNREPPLQKTPSLSLQRSPVFVERRSPPLPLQRSPVFVEMRSPPLPLQRSPLHAEGSPPLPLQRSPLHAERSPSRAERSPLRMERSPPPRRP